MKKMIVIIGLLLLCAGAAFAQGEPSAKFAAVWEDTPLIAETSVETCDPAVDPFETNRNVGTLLATMKMPNGKEILAGISAESFILLNTKVSGKNGASATATAWGKVGVKVKACNVGTGKCYGPVPDGKIVLNARLQSLSARLGGVIESCTDLDLDGTIDVGTDCTVSEEEIALLTATQSANSFNVVFVDLPQGTYEIRARFKVVAGASADTTSDPLEGQTACAYAGSYVVLGDRIVTLQDVRAVKGAITPIEF